MLEENNLSRCALDQSDWLRMASSFIHPDDVLHSRDLSVVEKRAILASWASDAHAVPNLPAMRQLESGAIVPVDAVLTALQRLDEIDGPRPRRSSARRLLAFVPRWQRRTRRDDDDDPPPSCPAAAFPPGIGLDLCRGRDEAWVAAA